MRTIAMRRPALFALLGAVALLSGCATQTPLPTASAAARSAHAAFVLEGRLSASDGEQAASGRLEWRHDDQQDEWTVFSPLGQVVARLTRTANGAVLHTANGERYQAASASELLPRALGIDAPVERLSGWVQAAPDAQAQVRQRDAAGRPTLVIDAGWRIEYPAYASDEAHAPPQRIDLSRGNARLRLIIDQWTFIP